MEATIHLFAAGLSSIDDIREDMDASEWSGLLPSLLGKIEERAKRKGRATHYPFIEIEDMEDITEHMWYINKDLYVDYLNRNEMAKMMLGSRGRDDRDRRTLADYFVTKIPDEDGEDSNKAADRRENEPQSMDSYVYGDFFILEVLKMAIGIYSTARLAKDGVGIAFEEFAELIGQMWPWDDLFPEELDEKRKRPSGGRKDDESDDSSNEGGEDEEEDQERDKMDVEDGSEEVNRNSGVERNVEGGNTNSGDGDNGYLYPLDIVRVVLLTQVVQKGIQVKPRSIAKRIVSRIERDEKISRKRTRNAVVVRRRSPKLLKTRVNMRLPFVIELLQARRRQPASGAEEEGAKDSESEEDSSD